MQEVLRSNLLSFFRILIPLAAIPLMTRLLSKSDLGAYYATLSFAAWVFIIAELGFSISASRKMVARGFNYGLFDSILLAKIMMISFLGLLALIAGIYFKGQASVIFFGWLMGSSQSLTLNWYFIANKNLSKLLLSDLIVQAVYLIGLILSYRFSGLGWEVYVLFNSILFISQTIYLYLFGVLKIEGARKAGITVDFKGAFNIAYNSKTILLNRLVTSVYTALGSFVVFSLGGAIQAAYFSNSDRLVKAANPINDVTVNSTFGSLVAIREDKARSDKAFLRIAGFLIGCSLIYTILIKVFVLKLVILIFGISYANMVGVVSTYVNVLPFIAYSYVLGILWFNTYEKEIYYTISTLTSIVCIFPVAIVLLKNHGLEGYAKGICLLEIFNATFMTLLAIHGRFYPYLRRRV